MNLFRSRNRPAPCRAAQAIPPRMTVRDLIAALKKLQPDATIVLAGEGDDFYLSFIDTKYYDPGKFIRLDGTELVSL